VEDDHICRSCGDALKWDASVSGELNGSIVPAEICGRCGKVWGRSPQSGEIVEVVPVRDMD
jgi:hypothetical protein